MFFIVNHANDSVAWCSDWDSLMLLLRDLREWSSQYQVVWSD